MSKTVNEYIANQDTVIARNLLFAKFSYKYFIVFGSKCVCVW